jgi:cullin 4
MKSLFTYLDRVYLTGQKKQDLGYAVLSMTSYFADRPHRSLAHAEFFGHILNQAPITRRIREGISTWVDEERATRKEHELRHVIGALVAQLQHHDLYSDIFESFYLKKTGEFYVDEGKELREQLNSGEFVRHLFARQSEEQQRALAVLPEESLDRITLEMNRSFMSGHLDWVANGGMFRRLCAPLLLTTLCSFAHSYGGPRSRD